MNIFENAKFGDKFRTRDGRKAIYNGRSIDRYWLIVERHPWNMIGFNSCGRHSGLEEDIDIISEWQEEINEEELDRLAKQEKMHFVRFKECNGLDLLSKRNKEYADLHNIYELMEKMYKAGYRKAKGF